MTLLVLRFILIALLVLPFVDLFLLVKVAEVIGFWQTIGVVLLTGIAGAELIRREGRFVLRKLQSSITVEEVSRNVLEGVMLVASGLLLLTPGLLTDLLGVFLVFRPLRERLVVRIARKMKNSGNVRVETFSLRP